MESPSCVQALLWGPDMCVYGFKVALLVLDMQSDAWERVLMPGKD